jgi:hypothetical protein
MDHEIVITKDFEVDDFGLLVFVDPLGEDKCSLSVCLTPFLGLWVVKWQTNDTFSQLVHDIAPKHLVNLRILNSK